MEELFEAYRQVGYTIKTDAVQLKYPWQGLCVQELVTALEPLIDLGVKASQEPDNLTLTNDFIPILRSVDVVLEEYSERMEKYLEDRKEDQTEFDAVALTWKDLRQTVKVYRQNPGRPAMDMVTDIFEAIVPVEPKPLPRRAFDYMFEGLANITNIDEMEAYLLSCMVMLGGATPAVNQFRPRWGQISTVGLDSPIRYLLDGEDAFAFYEEYENIRSVPGMQHTLARLVRLIDTERGIDPVEGLDLVFQQMRADILPCMIVISTFQPLIRGMVRMFPDEDDRRANWGGLLKAMAPAMCLMGFQEQPFWIGQDFYESDEILNLVLQPEPLTVRQPAKEPKPTRPFDDSRVQPFDEAGFDAPIGVIFDPEMYVSEDEEDEDVREGRNTMQKVMDLVGLGTMSFLFILPLTLFLFAMQEQNLESFSSIFTPVWATTLYKDEKQPDTFRVTKVSQIGYSLLASLFYLVGLFFAALEVRFSVRRENESTTVRSNDDTSEGTRAVESQRSLGFSIEGARRWVQNQIEKIQTSSSRTANDPDVAQALRLLTSGVSLGARGTLAVYRVLARPALLAMISTGSILAVGALKYYATTNIGTAILGSPLFSAYQAVTTTPTNIIKAQALQAASAHLYETAMTQMVRMLSFPVSVAGIAGAAYLGVNENNLRLDRTFNVNVTLVTIARLAHLGVEIVFSEAFANIVETETRGLNPIRRVTRDPATLIFSTQGANLVLAGAVSLMAWNLFSTTMGLVSESQDDRAPATLSTGESSPELQPVPATGAGSSNPDSDSESDEGPSSAGLAARGNNWQLERLQNDVDVAPLAEELMAPITAELEFLRGIYNIGTNVPDRPGTTAVLLEFRATDEENINNLLTQIEADIANFAEFASENTTTDTRRQEASIFLKTKELQGQVFVYLNKRTRNLLVEDDLFPLNPFQAVSPQASKLRFLTPTRWDAARETDLSVQILLRTAFDNTLNEARGATIDRTLEGSALQDALDEVADLQAPFTDMTPDQKVALVDVLIKYVQFISQSQVTT